MPNLQRVLDHYGLGKIEQEAELAHYVWGVRTGRGAFIVVVSESMDNLETKAAGVGLSHEQLLNTSHELTYAGKPLDVVHQELLYFSVYKAKRLKK